MWLQSYDPFGNVVLSTAIAALIVPGRARLLFAISQLSPRLGDWILRRVT